MGPSVTLVGADFHLQVPAVICLLLYQVLLGGRLQHSKYVQPSFVIVSFQTGKL